MVLLTQLPPELLQRIVAEADDDLCWLWSALRPVSSLFSNLVLDHFQHRVLPRLTISLTPMPYVEFASDELVSLSQGTFFGLHFRPSCDLGVSAVFADHIQLDFRPIRSERCHLQHREPNTTSDDKGSRRKCCCGDLREWAPIEEVIAARSEVAIEAYLPPNRDPFVRMKLSRPRLPVDTLDMARMKVRMEWRPLLALLLRPSYECSRMMVDTNLPDRIMDSEGLASFRNKHPWKCGCDFQAKKPFRLHIARLVTDVNRYVAHYDWSRSSQSKRQVLRRKAANCIASRLDKGLGRGEYMCLKCPRALLPDLLTPLQPKLGAFHSRHKLETYKECGEKGWVSVSPDLEKPASRRDKFKPKLKMPPSCWYGLCLCFCSGWVYCFAPGPSDG